MNKKFAVYFLAGGMKRTIFVLLTFTLMLTLATCGSTAGQGGTGSNPVQEGDTPASTTPEMPPEGETTAGTDDKKKDKSYAAYRNYYDFRTG